MENEFIIRRAVEADVSGIEAVARQTWNSTYAEIILPENRERLLGSYYSPDALKEAIAQAHSFLLVATAKETIIGFAQFTMREGNDRIGELSRVYVLPGRQRAGAGGRLLANGLAWLTQAGAERVLVVVEKDNPVGRRFYEKHGFNLIREFTAELPGQTLPLLEYQLDEFKSIST